MEIANTSQQHLQTINNQLNTSESNKFKLNSKQEIKLQTSSQQQYNIEQNRMSLILKDEDQYSIQSYSQSIQSPRKYTQQSVDLQNMSMNNQEENSIYQFSKCIKMEKFDPKQQSQSSSLTFEDQSSYYGSQSNKSKEKIQLYEVLGQQNHQLSVHENQYQVFKKRIEKINYHPLQYKKMASSYRYQKPKNSKLLNKNAMLALVNRELITDQPNKKRQSERQSERQPANKFWIDLIAIVAISVGYIEEKLEPLEWLYLIKLSQIAQFTQTIDEQFQFSRKFYAQYELTKLMVFLFYVGHVMGSGFHYISQKQYELGNTDVWIVYYKYENTNMIDRYVHSLYYAFITMSTVGYGDVTPISTIERIFGIIVTIVSCGIFGYSISTIQNIFADKSQKEANFKNIADQLQIEVIKHLQYQMKIEQDGQAQSEKILNNLPVALSGKIRKSFYGNILRNQRQFLGYSTAFLEELSLNISEKTYLPNEVLYELGDQNEKDLYDDKSDSTHYLYFIHKGIIELFGKMQHTPSENVDYPIEPDQQEFITGTIADGEVIGLYSFITQQPRNVSARSKTISQVLLLSREKFLKTLKKYPVDYDIFCARKDDLIQNGYRVKCLSCKYEGHRSTECPRIILKSQISQNYIDNQISEELKYDYYYYKIRNSYFYKREDRKIRHSVKVSNANNSKQVVNIKNDQNMISITLNENIKSYNNNNASSVSSRTNRNNEYGFESYSQGKINSLFIIKDVREKLKIYREKYVKYQMQYKDTWVQQEENGTFLSEILKNFISSTDRHQYHHSNYSSEAHSSLDDYEDDSIEDEYSEENSSNEHIEHQKVDDDKEFFLSTQAIKVKVNDPQSLFFLNLHRVSLGENNFYVYRDYQTYTIYDQEGINNNNNNNNGTHAGNNNMIDGSSPKRKSHQMRERSSVFDPFDFDRRKSRNMSQNTHKSSFLRSLNQRESQKFIYGDSFQDIPIDMGSQVEIQMNRTKSKHLSNISGVSMQMANPQLKFQNIKKKGSAIYEEEQPNHFLCPSPRHINSNIDITSIEENLEQSATNYSTQQNIKQQQAKSPIKQMNQVSFGAFSYDRQLTPNSPTYITNNNNNNVPNNNNNNLYSSQNINYEMNPLTISQNLYQENQRRATNSTKRNSRNIHRQSTASMAGMTDKQMSYWNSLKHYSSKSTVTNGTQNWKLTHRQNLEDLQEKFKQKQLFDKSFDSKYLVEQRRRLFQTPKYTSGYFQTYFPQNDYYEVIQNYLIYMENDHLKLVKEKEKLNNISYGKHKNQFRSNLYNVLKQNSEEINFLKTIYANFKNTQLQDQKIYVPTPYIDFIEWVFNKDKKLIKRIFTYKINGKSTIQLDTSKSNFKNTSKSLEKIYSKEISHSFSITSLNHNNNKNYISNEESEQQQRKSSIKSNKI